MRPNAFLVLMPAALLALAGCNEQQSPTGMAAPNTVSPQLVPAPTTSPGTIVAWGGGDVVSDVPSGNDFVAVSGGGAHALALRGNGTLVS